MRETFCARIDDKERLASLFTSEKPYVCNEDELGSNTSQRDISKSTLSRAHATSVQTIVEAVESAHCKQNHRVRVRDIVPMRRLLQAILVSRSFRRHERSHTLTSYINTTSEKGYSCKNYIQKGIYDFTMECNKQSLDKPRTSQAIASGCNKQYFQLNATQASSYKSETA